jgi:hypothetical protein
MKTKLRVILIPLVFVLATSGAFAQGKGVVDSKAATAKSEVKKTVAKAVPAASDAEIADALKAGKVWVNTDTKVYHKGGRWYGKTKEGKFMTEDEAKKGGFTAAKSEIGSKKG